MRALQKIASSIFPKWVNDPCDFALRRSTWGYPMMTFDDVNERAIFAILEILESTSMRAAFFVTGRDVEDKPDLLDAIVAAGHVLGNHSYSHPDMRGLSITEIEREVSRTQEIISAHGGDRLFRPPYGAISRPLADWLRKEDYSIVLWSIDSGDWRKGANVQKIVATASKATVNDIVLMHALPVTVQALPLVLDRLSEKGLLPHEQERKPVISG